MTAFIYMLMVAAVSALLVLLLYVHHVRCVVLVKDLVISFVIVAYVATSLAGLHAAWRSYVIFGLLGVVFALRGLQLYTPLGTVFEKEVRLWK